MPVWLGIRRGGISPQRPTLEDAAYRWPNVVSLSLSEFSMLEMDIRKENKPTVIILLLILEFSSRTNLGIILPFLFNVPSVDFCLLAFVIAIPFILMTHELIRFLNWRGIVLECHSVHLWACRYAEQICHTTKWHGGKEAVCKVCRYKSDKQNGVSYPSLCG